MTDATGADQPAQPPKLLHYETWADERGYHARFDELLPDGALGYGCVQEVQAPTETELTQEAVRNRVRVWTWQTSRSGDEVPFTTGDMS
ncbi:hypothetical protein FH608_045865 [Nonomuraea phyllanthi]|uniref:Uncharacterized protein n=1 Tax=Nonomuraea phyllanthi TaxID=2219224 RepID=A0A5C4V747_9ACTN|nr:hypothetical protein [Nonomuraea phyllanthi]KAB8186824.1 hypothetical protein FH608_045865 [Nonomuraea phyllanthi]